MASLAFNWFYWYNVIMNICEDCNKVLVKSTARWCKTHGYKHRTRPSGLKYKVTKDNPTSFKKGHKPWNANTKGLVKANSGSIKKGERRSVKTEFNKYNTKGNKNHNWKGDEVGYQALHAWVKRELGKAVVCNKCQSNVKVEWANISFDYIRDKQDWVSLCHKCHMANDAQYGWGKATERFGKL